MSPKYTCTNASGEVDIRMGSSGPEAAAPTTVIARFRERISEHRDLPALKVKRGGDWITYTWMEYYEQCRAFAKSLLSLGHEAFESVNVIGFNSPEWLISNCGAILAQGIAAGIYTTNGPEACKYIAEHSEARVVVCDGVAQLNKFKEIAKSLKKLKALVIYNAKAPEGFDAGGVPVYSFEDFIKLGVDVDDAKLDARMDAVKPGHCSTLIYTSGTTGNPKGVMISHDNVTWTASTLISIVEDGLSPADRMVSYLPLSHIAAQMLDIHAPLYSGMCLYFAQPDALKGSLGGTLKEVRPTIFFGVPRVWEKIAEKMWAIGKSTKGLKKTIATWAKSKGTQKNQMAQFGESGGVPCGFGCAHAIVLSKVHDALGLDQVRYCFTGAAPISLEVLEYFASLDIRILELFGQSECTGPQTVNTPSRWKMGSAGCAMPGTEMKVVPETNELIYCGRHIMMGYLKEDAKTAETIDSDGYLHSGDCAKVDGDGFMSITGRIKELIITAGGENIPPVIIEEKIKEHTKALSNVMVIGDKRKFLIALYTVRVEMDGNGEPTQKLDGQALEVAESIGSSAKTVSEVKACGKFKEYFDSKLADSNKEATSRAQNVGKWVLLDVDFSVPGGELTPTLKLKRRIVADKYSNMIDAAYGA